MKNTKTNIAIIAITALTTIGGTLVCSRANDNCRALLSAKPCIAESMRKLKLPSFKQNAPLQGPVKNSNAKPCLAIKKEVFVDGRRLYWGNPGDLMKPESFFAPRSLTHKEGERVAPTPEKEALQQFLHELRAAIKAFEKRQHLKVKWRKTKLAMPDMTTSFINFWDEGFEIKPEGYFTQQTNMNGKGTAQ